MSIIAMNMILRMLYKTRITDKLKFIHRNRRQVTVKQSIKQPTAGFAKIYKIGNTDVIRPITSAEIPSCFPITGNCGKIGPIAKNQTHVCHRAFLSTKSALPAIKKKQCALIGRSDLLILIFPIFGFSGGTLALISEFFSCSS